MDGGWVTGYRLSGDHDERYAGFIREEADGSKQIDINLGWRLHGPGSGASHQIRIELGQVNYTTAERRLLDEALAARANPNLVWRFRITPATKRISQTNGWWQDGLAPEYDREDAL